MLFIIEIPINRVRTYAFTFWAVFFIIQIPYVEVQFLYLLVYFVLFDLCVSITITVYIICCRILILYQYYIYKYKWFKELIDALLQTHFTSEKNPPKLNTIHQNFIILKIVISEFCWKEGIIYNQFLLQFISNALNSHLFSDFILLIVVACEHCLVLTK